MTRELLKCINIIKGAAEEVRDEQDEWIGLRESQKLRWRPRPFCEEQPLKPRPAWQSNPRLDKLR